MKEDNTDDTFLADWLAGNLTDDGLRTKVSADDFNAYRKLRASLDSVELTQPDIERNYAAVKAKKSAALDRRYHSKALPLYRYAAIAASVLLLIGLFNVFVFSNSTTTGFGQQSKLVLGDASSVTLNAKSHISYPNYFSINRSLKLDGEAFFEVSKGSRFTVKTAAGEVEVLGTKFNVMARGDFLEVVCYEGRVRVCSGESERILLPGEAVRFFGRAETWKTDRQTPLWTTGESDFNKVPYELVIEALENQYGKSVSFPKTLQYARFTGSFTHKNLQTALQSVCIPMQLKFTESDGKITITE